MTNEQAIIIGREIGRTIVAEFFARIQSDNPKRMTQMPSDYLLKTLGKAIGEAIKENQ